MILRKRKNSSFFDFSIIFVQIYEQREYKKSKPRTHKNLIYETSNLLEIRIRFWWNRDYLLAWRKRPIIPDMRI